MPPTPEETSASSPSSGSYSSAHHACNELLFLRNARTSRQMIPYFVEFYDLKSSMRLTREHRNHLYRNIDGIILVYDLLDMKTHDNLHDWLYQPLRQICRHRHKRLRPILRRRHVPILVVGTKLDMLKSRRLRRSGSIADQLGTEEILLNCLDANSLAEKTRNEGKLRKFLNKAVDFKQYFPSRRSNWIFMPSSVYFLQFVSFFFFHLVLIKFIYSLMFELLFIRSSKLSQEATASGVHPGNADVSGRRTVHRVGHCWWPHGIPSPVPLPWPPCVPLASDVPGVQRRYLQQAKAV